jgi:hypothetical protein
MKFFRSVAVLQLCLFFAACDLSENDSAGTGQLRVAFNDSGSVLTRSAESMPDTSDFLLTITDASGKIIYNGTFGACPECLEVKAGSYVVKALSSEFTKPAFSSPQYGDEVCVVVPSGGVADVKLLCSQMNSGVKLDIDDSFLSGCPDGVLFLKSSEGKLMYSYKEKRIAYFLPGLVSLVLSRGGKDEVLLMRNLQARQVLALGVSVASDSSEPSFQGLGDLTVSVDTSKVWLEDSYVIGGGADKGSSVEDAMTVSSAISNAPKDDVWVSGYIVGGDLTSTSASFDDPFKSRTNILLGPKSSTVDRDACLAVQLPSGSVRDALNLVDNPDMLGRKVCLKGDLVESYFGLVGLKSVDMFHF